MRSGFGVHTRHHFVLPKLRLVFRNEHAQSTSLGPKQSIWVVSRDSVAGRYPLLDRVWGAYNAPLCASEVASCFFATNTPNPFLEAQN